MSSRYIYFFLFFLVLVGIEIYIYQGAKHLLRNQQSQNLRYTYISFTLIALAFFLFYNFGGRGIIGRYTQTIILSTVLINFSFKILAFIFMLVDDLVRLGKWLTLKVFPPEGTMEQIGQSITRSDFILQTGLIIASIPAAAIGWGIISGAYDYTIRRIKLNIANLPDSFKGKKIIQITDIHSGSFYNHGAVEKGVEMIMKENADLIFFTGDLVNTEAKEMDNYIALFSEIKAPLGVYSVLGNHDYGDYKKWSTEEEKVANLDRLKDIHKQMGWQLLNNAHKKVSINNESIAILGVENWGALNWSQKYGDLDIALKGCEEVPVKLLLSHDPSHWDAQILPHPVKIDATFSGHTHGMQFGVEIGQMKWSPVQYIYKQWAGLYKKDGQQLYVNRGFGFIGFPGRVGILPEITVFELA